MLDQERTSLPPGKRHYQRAWWILLSVGALLLSTCGPNRSPTAPAASSSTPHSTTVPRSTPPPTTTTAPTITPASPTWTPLPSPTPTSSQTAVPTRPPTPPWSTPLPTPTSAPPLYPNILVGTYFFFWHNCPTQSCDPNRIYAVPPGWHEPLTGDSDARDGLYYSSYNRYWYFQELRDMRLAGIEVVLPVNWGDNIQPWFRTAVLQNMVEANRQLDPPLRIGLFDDTTSEVREYRDYADNQSFDYSAYSETGIPLSLQDPIAGFLFYDRKIRPFFQTIPQDMWATHDGRPVEEGGRPIIVVYNTQDIIHLDRAGAVWAGIKAAFQRDFRDSNGQPITPWLILEISWFTDEALNASPSLSEVVDGKYGWGSALNGLQVRDWRDYTVTSMGPGFDSRNYYAPQPGQVQPRHRDPDGGEGDAGTFLRWNLEQIPPRTDLLLIETWNELLEGTLVCRADYPLISGQPVREDFFIDLLRQALRGQSLWLAAQPLPPDWPPWLGMSQSSRLVLQVQNIGTRTWSAAGGEHLLLSGDLFPQAYRVFPQKPVRPGEVGQFVIDLITPPEAGLYDLSWQMYGTEGPFGPAANWTISVEAPTIATSLYVAPPKETVLVGDSFTLTLELVPPVPVTAVHLRVRFDPAALRMEGMQPLLGRRAHSWQIQVDNDLGEGSLESHLDASEATRWISQLDLQALTAGEVGIWIERTELWLENGVALVLEAQWVPLNIQAE